MQQTGMEGEAAADKLAQAKQISKEDASISDYANQMNELIKHTKYKQI